MGVVCAYTVFSLAVAFAIGLWLLPLHLETKFATAKLQIYPRTYQIYVRTYGTFHKKLDDERRSTGGQSTDVHRTVADVRRTDDRPIIITSFLRIDIGSPESVSRARMAYFRNVK